MSLDLNANTISIADVLATLRDCRGRDWNCDSGFAFASDLTGLSIDKLWELTEDKEVRADEAKKPQGTQLEEASEFQKLCNEVQSIQHKMLTQDTCCQASPRFWGIMEPQRDYGIAEEYADGYYLEDTVDTTQKSIYTMEDLSTVFHDLEEDLKDAMSAEKMTLEVSQNGLSVSFIDEEGDEADSRYFYDLLDASEWLNETLEADRFQSVGYKDTNTLARGPLFLTKEAAEKYLEKYGYNHPKGSHPYAMTAYRSTEIETVWKLLETTDWKRLASLAPMLSEDTLYVYKEYNDGLAYGEEFLKLCPSREDATDLLCKRIQEDYGKTLEELRADPAFSNEILDDDYVSICNGGPVSFYIVDRLENPFVRPLDKGEKL